MSELAVTLWPTGVFALATLLVVAVVFASEWLFVTRPQRRTRDRGLLREPARALRRRLDAVNHRLVGAAMGLTATALAWYLVFDLALPADDIWALLALSAAGAIAGGWFAEQMLRLWPERLQLVRAIDAQMVTAQSLNLLMRSEYWVFHDVHIGGHRINHLVMGRRGVFCVDARWRRPRRRWSWRGPAPMPAARARFDGRRLEFPGWAEVEPSREVEAQAQWLRRWLRERTDGSDDVPAYAAIALPGWQITASEWKRVIVFNPATPNMMVEAADSDRRLDASVARHLVRELQRHCREDADTRMHGATRTPWARLVALLRARLART